MGDSSNAAAPEFSAVGATSPDGSNAFPGDELIRGLTSRPRMIPNKYYYDETGVLLFDMLCRQPEYYLMTAETELLHRHAAEIGRISGRCDIIDLGCGSATKAPILLSALGSHTERMHYTAFDLDGNIVGRAIDCLSALFPLLSFNSIVASYDQGIHRLPASTGRRLFLSLGSSFTNLWDHEVKNLLQSIWSASSSGDLLLIGVDLVKPAGIVEAAYNDAMGIAAQTNLNVLKHINRRFGADFDPTRFQHHSIYNEAAGRGESHLRSVVRQAVRIAQLDFSLHLDSGELILTEIERKYRREDLRRKVEASGFSCHTDWVHERYQYGLFLFERVEAGASS